MTETKRLNYAAAIAAALFALALALGACSHSATTADRPHRVDMVEAPSCPEEDSCDIDYRAGAWYVESGFDHGRPRVEYRATIPGACPAEDSCQPSYTAGRWSFPRTAH